MEKTNKFYCFIAHVIYVKSPWEVVVNDDA